MSEVLALGRIPLDDYAELLGAGEIEELRALATPLLGRSIQMVNSTAVGGGVAEILTRLVPLAEELDLNIKWEVMGGGEDFFEVTKAFHNALDVAPYHASQRHFDIFLAYNKMNREKMPLDAEFMVIHDPQPAALIETRKPGANHWVWRCHIDLSHPNRTVWDFLEQFVSKYDGAMFSSPEFSRQLPIPQYLFYPAIDPLSEKNCELEQEFVGQKLARGIRAYGFGSAVEKKAGCSLGRGRNPHPDYSQAHRIAVAFRRRHGVSDTFSAVASGDCREAGRARARTREGEFSHHAKAE